MARYEELNGVLVLVFELCIASTTDADTLDLVIICNMS